MDKTIELWVKSWYGCEDKQGKDFDQRVYARLMMNRINVFVQSNRRLPTKPIELDEWWELNIWE